MPYASSSAMSALLIAMAGSSARRSDAVAVSAATKPRCLRSRTSVRCQPTPEVIEDKPGNCPKCGMRLTPVRLDTTWTCPIHGAVHKDAPGRVRSTAEP